MKMKDGSLGGIQSRHNSAYDCLKWRWVSTWPKTRQWRADRAKRPILVLKPWAGELLAKRFYTERPRWGFWLNAKAPKKLTTEKERFSRIISEEIGTPPSLHPEDNKTNTSMNTRGLDLHSLSMFTHMRLFARFICSSWEIFRKLL